MNKSAKLLKTLAISFAVVAIYACSSSDDGSNPPPGVDCNATGPSISSLTPTATDCGQDNGSIAVAGTGGTNPLQVSIDPEPLDFDFANNTYTNLEPGTYTIEITDADNCSASETAVVAIEGGGVSYMNDIDPIIQANCILSGCHDGSNPAAPNFTNFAVFQTEARDMSALGVRIKIKTNDMPRDPANNTVPGTPLSDADKVLLFCWIDEGAQDN